MSAEDAQGYLPRVIYDQVYWYMRLVSCCIFARQRERDVLPVADALEELDGNARVDGRHHPEHGTYETVKARFWPWLPIKSLEQSYKQLQFCSAKRTDCCITQL